MDWIRNKLAGYPILAAVISAVMGAAGITYAPDIPPITAAEDLATARATIEALQQTVEDQQAQLTAKPDLEAFVQNADLVAGYCRALAE